MGSIQPLQIRFVDAVVAGLILFISEFSAFSACTATSPTDMCCGMTDVTTLMCSNGQPATAILLEDPNCQGNHFRCATGFAQNSAFGQHTANYNAQTNQGSNAVANVSSQGPQISQQIASQAQQVGGNANTGQALGNVPISPPQNSGSNTGQKLDIGNVPINPQTALNLSRDSNSTTSTNSALKDTAERSGSTYNVNNGDDCPHSAQIDPKYGCHGTYTVIQAANMSNMLSMTAGSMVTAGVGQNAQMQVMQQNTQASALKAAATTQETGADVELGIGAMNTALGIYQMMRGSQHTSQGSTISAASGDAKSLKVQEVVAKGGVNNASEGRVKDDELNKEPGFRDAGTVYTDNGRNSIQYKILNSFKLNENSGYTKLQTVTANPDDPNSQALLQEQINMRNKQGQDIKRSLATTMYQIGGQANDEQKRVASAAMVGGMMSTMFGVQQLAQGGLGRANAERLKAAANALGNTSPNLSKFNFTPPQANDFAQGVQAPFSPNTITGDGVNPNGNGGNSPVTGPTDTPPDLGKGFNPLPMNSGVPGGPQAGKFSIGNPQGGGGGGGGGVESGGSTSADKAPNEEPQSKMAPNEKGTAYESGGTFTGGGGGPGKGAEGGPDLNSLLAKFLPKKDEADTPKNGILQFGSDAPPTPQNNYLLDRGANLFKRISDTMHDKYRNGMI